MKLFSKLRDFLSARINHVIVTFRFSIVSVFISLFILTTAALIAVTSYRFSVSMNFISSELMEEMSKNIFEEITVEMQHAGIIGDLSANLIQSNIVSQNSLPEISNYAFQLLKREYKEHSTIQSIYWGNEDGDFVRVAFDEHGNEMSEIIDRSQPYTGFLTYDPRTRPWYLNAKKSGKTSWTDVYQLAARKTLGITTSTPVYDQIGKLKGVFSVNIQLNFLRNFIEKEKVSENGLSFIVTKSGKLVAFPHVVQYRSASLIDIHSIAFPWVIHSFEEYKKLGSNVFNFEYDGKKYLAVYKQLPGAFEQNWIVGIVAPEDDFNGELHKTNRIVIGVSLIIFLLGVVLISKLVSQIVKPLKKLTDEIDKIKDFNLEGDSRIHTSIKEVLSISESFQAMKLGLRSFQKYVPATLVRQLIELGEDVRIGGVKRPLVVFFSDIVSFTPLAEKEEPEKLTKHLCDYFAELSRIISEEKGTIDKYIGDSIMAFWGAPLEQEFPAVLAAQAALRCKQRLLELNEAWKQAQIPIFRTRIGLHMGEAIVGNIGSNERINYTAIGDTINFASRLEGINKKYGTEITVSQAVYDQICKKFVLRKVDYVKLKGRGEPGFIYELLAKDRNEISFDLDRYTENFEAGFSAYSQKMWDKAAAFFKECVSIFPEDTVAPVFIQRCESFKSNPPPADWNGLWDHN